MADAGEPSRTILKDDVSVLASGEVIGYVSSSPGVGSAQSTSSSPSPSSNGFTNGHADLLADAPTLAPIGNIVPVGNVMFGGTLTPIMEVLSKVNTQQLVSPNSKEDSMDMDSTPASIPVEEAYVLDQPRPRKRGHACKPVDADDRLARRRKKNREAAQKFRLRQKSFIKTLEDRVADADHTSSELVTQMNLIANENRMLRDQLEYLRTFILQSFSVQSLPSGVASLAAGSFAGDSVINTLGLGMGMQVPLMGQQERNREESQPCDIEDAVKLLDQSQSPTNTPTPQSGSNNSESNSR